MRRREVGGAIAFLPADAVFREVLNPRKVASVGSVGEGVSTGTLLALPSALFP